MPAKKEISSVIKAVEVIKCLFAGDNKVSRIADKLGYDKSNVQRILKTLVTAGFATQNPINRRYYPGWLLHSLSSNYLGAHRILNEIALKHMKILRDTIEETVNLQIPMGVHRLIVEIVFMRREYMYYAQAGDTSPVYSGAAGKVLLSMLADDDLKQLLNKLSPLPSYQRATIDKEQLMESIKQAGINGYATEYYNSPVGGGAISVSVTKYICPVVLTALGLESRLKPNQSRILAEMKNIADNISGELAMVYG